MKCFAEFYELGVDVVIPRFGILLNEIVLPLLVKLFNQTGLIKPKHLKVGLNLDHLIDPHLVEQTPCPVLDLYQNL